MQYIYGLLNNSTNELLIFSERIAMKGKIHLETGKFYIGKTTVPETRLINHRNTTAKKFRRHCRMEIIEQGSDLSNDDEFFWMAYFKSIGCALINKRFGRGYRIEGHICRMEIIEEGVDLNGEDNGRNSFKASSN